MIDITIAIPIYEYGGKGFELLEFSFNKMLEQTFTNFDIVVSDNSQNTDIKEVCEKWKKFLDIKYYTHPKHIVSPASDNTTNSVRMSTGRIIKLLCADDYLYDNNALKIIYDNFDDNTNFLATGYYHTNNRLIYENKHVPELNNYLCIVNTIGTPSCVAIRNFGLGIPFFDTNLTYVYDAEFYFRFISKFERVKLIPDVTIANYLWENSVTSSVSQELINKENEYVLRKHGFING